MNKSGKIAVLGDSDSIAAFRAVGAETYAVTYENAADVLSHLAYSGKYGIIFVVDKYVDVLNEVMTELRQNPYPCVTIIPSCEGSSGTGMARIRKDVEKAVGADIIGE